MSGITERRASWGIVILALTAIASGQVTTGTPGFGSFGGGPFDVVNLGSLNAHFAVPVIHKAGRGLPFGFDLAYDSSIWTPVTVNGSKVWQPAGNWGWSADSTAVLGYVATQTGTATCPNGQGGTTTVNFTVYLWYRDPLGTMHSVNLSTFAGCTGNPPLSKVLDNGDTFSDWPGITVTSVGGRVISPVVGSGSANGNVTDANGNQITTSNSGLTFTDTLSQTVMTISNPAPPPGFSKTNAYSYIPPANEGSGTRVSVTMNYIQYTVATNFGAKDGSGSPIGEYGATAVSLPDNITLADGTQYKFTYESTPGTCTPLSGTYSANCVTARIASVTLPTGGSITYGYSGGYNGILSDGSTAGLSRQLSPGGTWTYARTQDSGMASHWTTTVSTPLDNDNSPAASNVTVIDFQKDSATANNTNNFYEVQRQSYQGPQSGPNLLLTIITCWNGTTSSCTTTAVSTPISQTSVTTQYPGTNVLQGKNVTFYNGYILPTETDHYAFATGTPTAILRKTLISYASLGNFIVDRPASVTVTDGSGNTLSKTTYNYDETAYPVQATSGTPQHVSVTGSRGNATSISRYSTASTTLVSHLQYYDTGTLYKSFDVNGATTSYTYGTATQGNSTVSCGNSFATSFTLPISGLSSLASTTWDCFGGVATQVKDLNGNATNVTFTDPYFWRPASTQDPVPNTTSFTYTHYDSTTNPVTLASAKSSMSFGSSLVEKLTTADLLGRGQYAQQREGPGSANYDSTQVIYDTLGRAYQSTMPCVTSAGLGCPSAAKTTSTFDALGRLTQTTDGGNPTPGYVSYTYNQNDVKQAIGPAPSGENLKQKQLEYDALGRLTSVCELTSLTGYGNCAQTTNYNGYWTTYSYDTTTINSVLYTRVTVTQNAQAAQASQQTRQYVYDLLGRLVQETNPENGTTTYTYDSASGCTGTSNGDLVKRVDAKGNNICYQYDSLHRVTSISYPTGPDAANTPTKTFVYDSATFNSTAMSNPKGRLAEAYTGASGSKTTDEFFSYSVRGEQTDTYQCTPHSGSNGCASVSNYYHVTAAFWANGALSSLSSNVSGVPTQTYGVDPMGRPYSVTAGSGQNPVTSATYDLANFKTTVNYGSLDSDVVTLDPNTGRMTKSTFNVGSNSDTGTTTWNANGSLATLAISNTVPGTSDTQTCSYTHDDLARISGVNCVNGQTNKWNQNFTYDAFGNITKTSSGPGIAFMPNYDTTKNWITSLPGPITTTTDANGQMTYDGTHNYTWDAEGKMISVDTTTLTHDALGRMVEKNVSGTYTQIVYSPLGKFALMNGQTLQKGYVPLPGAQAVYTSSGLTYYRHADHLGSSRLATTPSRTMYSSTAYAPYGEPYSQAGATDLSFTGQDQDTVSGIHDFLARKYPPVQGRWLSPDPAGLAAANPANPQSWNRYAYVVNNPLSLVDPLGLANCSIISGGANCHPEDPQQSWIEGFSDQPNLAAMFGVGGPIGSSALGGASTFGSSALDGASTLEGNGSNLSDPLGSWIKQDWCVETIDSATGSDDKTCGWDWVPATPVSYTPNELLAGAAAANNDSPLWAGTKTFFNGLIHGVRQPGQTFGECVNQNVSDTTLGKVDPKKLFNQGLTTLETTATLLGATKLPTAVGPSVPVGPYLAGQLARALGQGAASTAAFVRVAAGGMQALAVTGAATAGMAIGSAINCR